MAASTQAQLAAAVLVETRSLAEEDLADSVDSVAHKVQAASKT